MTQQTQTTTKQDTEGHATISSPNLQHALDSLSRIQDNAKLEIENGQLAYHMVDPAHVALLKGTAPLIHQENDATLCFDLEQVMNIMKHVKLTERDPFRIAWTQDDISIETPNHHTYTLDRLDSSGITNPKTPDLDLPCKFRFKARDLWDAIRRANALHAQYVALEYEGNALHVTTQVKDESGEDHAEPSTIEYEALIETDMVRCREDHVRSLFSLDYFREFTLASGWQGTATIELGTDYPFLLSVEPAEAKITHTLAPRIESA